MARWRRESEGPWWESMPGELQAFDPREWALAGEVPDREDRGQGSTDYWRCHQRYWDAVRAWLAVNDPAAEFDVLQWLRMRHCR